MKNATAIIWIPALLSLLVGTTAPVQAADKELLLQFQVDEKTTTESDEQGKPSAPVTTTGKESYSVGLGKNYIYIKSGNSQIVYRFDTKRLLMSDAASENQADCSLYYVVAFRDLELQNRLLLRKVVQSAVSKDKANMYMGSDVALEAQFGMPVPRGEQDAEPAPLTEQDTESGGKEFLLDKKVIASFKPGAALNPEFKAMFSKFLLYGTHLTPQVRRAIEAQNKLPSSLYFRAGDPLTRQSEQTWTLKSVSETAGGLPQITAEKCTEDVPAADVSQVPSREAVIEFIGRRVKDNNYLDAFLALTEYRLVLDVTLDEELQKMKDGLRTDANVLKIAAALAPANDKEAQDAVVTLKSIDRTGLEKGYLLDIFLANTYGLLQKPEAGIKLFRDVLRKHPYISGAYVDLGKLYYSEFSTNKAWNCWDQARKIAPQHSMLKGVDALEHDLQKQHPEFF